MCRKIAKTMVFMTSVVFGEVMVLGPVLKALGIIFEGFWRRRAPFSDFSGCWEGVGKLMI